MSDHPLAELLRDIRRDLTYAQTKLTDAFAMLETLNLPGLETRRCQLCGYRPSMNLPSLAEHMLDKHSAHQTAAVPPPKSGSQP